MSKVVKNEKEPTTLTLSSLTRTAKLYALDSSITDEEFLNALLEPVVQAGNVKAKMGAEFKLDKSRTSKILSGKADIPKQLKKPLGRIDIEEKVAEGFESFLEESFDIDCFGEFRESIEGLLNDDFEASKRLRKKLESLRGNPQAYFAHCLIAAIKESNLSPSAKALWQSGTGSFGVEVGDLLGKGFGRPKKQKNIVVIPVNTGFDTEITWQYEGSTTPLVSATSIHGQWLIRMFKTDESPEVIKTRIAKDLDERGIKRRQDRAYDETACVGYELGTIAIIENNKAVFYLLAISSFDSKNNAQSTPELISNSLDRLFEHYDACGQGLDMYLPLLGTGMSRANLSHGDSFALIREAVERNRSRLHGKVTLMVHPNDADKLDIGL